MQLVAIHHMSGSVTSTNHSSTYPACSSGCMHSWPWSVAVVHASAAYLGAIACHLHHGFESVWSSKVQQCSDVFLVQAGFTKDKHRAPLRVASSSNDLQAQRCNRARSIGHQLGCWADVCRERPLMIQKLQTIEHSTSSTMPPE